MSTFTSIYRYVRQIPAGKVATYGQIASIYNAKNPKSISAQLVGFALHANRSKKTPCHRVVTKSGRLAPNFAFNGSKVQKALLKNEGVTFKKNSHVNLTKHQMKLKTNNSQNAILLTWN